MKAVTASEMREIDRISIEECSIPATVLMNNAGRSVADFIIKNFNTQKVDIFCGTGNNGGDGFTAAFYLKNAGIEPVLYIAGKKEKITAVSLLFLEICKKYDIEILYVDDTNIDSLQIQTDSLILDSITGTGFEGPLRGIPLRLVNLINSSTCEVISVDIPSGLPSDGDAPAGDAVEADYTITMGLPKISLVTWPGKGYCGRLSVSDIGFPPYLTGSNDLKVDLADEGLVKDSELCKFSEDIHKGDMGNTLIVGGFTGMEGAAMLTASAMFKTGTGLVTLATVESSRSSIAGIIPELMTASLPDSPDPDSVELLLRAKKYNTLIIGPGMGRDSYSEVLFNTLLEKAQGAGISDILIDGDGLIHLASYLKQKKIPEGIKCIITPHFMEASRISGHGIDYIKNNRLKSCVELAKSTGCVTVLKGPASIISDGLNSCINTTGNRALATAGSGDVLSGIIGALAGRGIDLYQAACAGVYIHGLCADIFAECYEKDSMSSSDILEFIRPSLEKIKS